MNLSDYEEKGDSEDEQMKARKKRKYEPRPNQDSDGEESSLSTRAGPYSARNVFINPTEGFKYSDLYMVCTWEIFGEGKNWWIMSYLPKFSSSIFTDTLKMYLAYALTVAYLPKFSLPIAFTCTVCQKIFPAKHFLCGIIILLVNVLLRYIVMFGFAVCLLTGC